MPGSGAEGQDQVPGARIRCRVPGSGTEGQEQVPMARIRCQWPGSGAEYQDQVSNAVARGSCMSPPTFKGSARNNRRFTVSLAWSCIASPRRYLQYIAISGKPPTEGTFFKAVTEHVITSSKGKHDLRALADHSAKSIAALLRFLS